MPCRPLFLIRPLPTLYGVQDCCWALRGRLGQEPPCVPKPSVAKQESQAGIVPDHVRALYGRMQDEMIPLVQRHVVSIAAYYNGGLHQHATGTLVQFFGHYFVVTAARYVAQALILEAQPGASRDA